MWSILNLSDRSLAKLKNAGKIGQSEEEDALQANVWVPDEKKVWTVANIVQEKANELLVEIPDDKRRPFNVPRKDIHQYDPSHALDLDDASKMNGMHEAPLLDLLYRRFKNNKIYTNMADVLVSINPYKSIPLLYEIPLLQLQDESEEEFEESDGDDEILATQNNSLMDQRPDALKRMAQKPHVHSIADRAFRYMTEPEREYQHGKTRALNQSIIITGESGAGKTEASKHVMRYLITAAQLLNGSDDEHPVDAMAKRTEAVLIESNTILEAFGNAKTLRNDNSSRFGKYIKLLYDGTFNLIGAKTEHFLLEKSRLVRVDKAERGYHIFYQLCKGLPADEAQKLHLTEPSNFKGIYQGGCVDLGDDVDDGREFETTRSAMKTLGFTSDETSAIWKLLAAILHMGNITFKDIESKEGTIGDESKTAMIGSDLISMEELDHLLGLKGDILEYRVVRRSMSTTRGTTHDIPLNSQQAKDNLDGLIKHAYGNLFAWIVWKINKCHNEQVSKDLFSESENGMRSFIGILDIFGFEIMTTNSFEQLCINYANEVLQRQFNQQVFVKEQQEYILEGLNVQEIPFTDNQRIIDLISKKPLGLMPILEDQVLTGRKAHSFNNLTDKKLLDLYHQEHHRKNPHPNYAKPRFENDQFILHHYAGVVTYDIEGFLEKNNDSLQADLKTLLLESSDSLVRTLVGGSMETGFILTGDQLEVPSTSPQRKESSGRVRRNSQLASASTVSATFRKQLENLADQLSLTEPHYIKCIKPNSLKAPGGWSSPLVIEQLRYSGVLEVVRIRREAFPTRLNFAEFCARFGELIKWRIRGIPDPQFLSRSEARKYCGEICKIALESSDDYQLGSHKVFLKDDGLDRLRWALQQHYVAIATRVQKCWRGLVARRRVERQKDAAIKIQKIVRGYKARIEAKKLAEEKRQQQQRAAIVMQAYLRRMLAKKWSKLALQRAMLEKESAITLQKAARRMIAQREYNKTRKAAIALQSVARGQAARKLFCSLKTHERLRMERETRKAIKIQAWARMVIAKRDFHMKKAKATAIQAAIRGRRARAAYERFKKAIVVIQSLARMIKARHAYIKNIKCITKIQALARGMIARMKYHNAIQAIKRIQRAGKSYTRNKYLERCVKKLFSAVASGDSNSVTASITNWPELLFVRNYWNSDRIFPGLVHASCIAGQLNILTLLEPFPDDIFLTDRLGNTAMHYAAEASHYNLCKYIGKRANLDVDAIIMKEDTRKAETNYLSNKRVRSNMNVFKRQRIEMAIELKKLNKNKGVVQKKSGYYDSTLMMAGYLKKRRETDRWIRRWCVLTETHLMYFHKKTDDQPSKAIRLDSAMLKKSEHINFAFEIHTPNLLDKRNKEGRLYFQADSEATLQMWLVPLRMVVGLYQFRHDKRREPMEYLNTDIRKKIVLAQNRKGKYPLHFCIGSKQQTKATAALHILSWLVENGADPNGKDDSGESALHVAAVNGNSVAVALLASKGGRMTSKRKDGKKVSDLIGDISNEMPKELQVNGRMTPLQPPPDKLYGFTYLSVLIEKTNMGSTGGVFSPLLTISVYNAKGQVSEGQQDIPTASLIRPGYFWWGKTWHMQTPLETIGEGSYVIFELKDVTEARKLRTFAWGVFNLNLDEINTRAEMLNMYEAPVDLGMKSTHIADVIVQGEVVLTKGKKKKVYEKGANTTKE
mmetsp:Transcript_16662/g.23589  ORF Transcript_16662/g.23589 Transcript_16662/m.23589 type:complete len:1681 (+) Transcript_16662:67-5109(+)|eukprot:CAMPEP_0171457586 /NCGR_PEP_ID=MMETSP0945-20130129/3609_1 /TAXON_ID=109269 /ORGANISM="Vaucheria litorea, Strain CCMP2940" /LENGTH=1680 /DNA_ID=CAMNT_0011983231 /DNA_START=71 /DNA_END=5113 /DNA_ORIENTATION=+